MNAISLALAALIALVIAAALAHLIGNKRKGISDCGCGCGRCNRCSGSNVDLPDCCEKERES